MRQCHEEQCAKSDGRAVVEEACGLAGGWKRLDLT